MKPYPLSWFPSPQVKNRNNEWIEAPPIPGTLVINIGDMLEVRARMAPPPVKPRRALLPIDRYHAVGQ